LKAGPNTHIPEFLVSKLYPKLKDSERLTIDNSKSSCQEQREYSTNFTHFISQDLQSAIEIVFSPEDEAITDIFLGFIGVSFSSEFPLRRS